MGLDPFTIIAGAALLGGTAVNVRQQRKARNAQERAQRLEARRQEIAANRERRKQLRSQRRETAQLRALSVTQGTQGTSSVQSRASNIRSEVASNLSFIDQNVGLVNAIGAANQSAANALSRGQVAQSIGNLGFEAVGSGLFSKKPPATPDPDIGGFSPDPNRVTF